MVASIHARTYPWATLEQQQGEQHSRLKLMDVSALSFSHLKHRKLEGTWLGGVEEALRKKLLRVGPQRLHPTHDIWAENHGITSLYPNANRGGLERASVAWYA